MNECTRRLVAVTFFLDRLFENSYGTVDASEPIGLARNPYPLTGGGGGGAALMTSL